MEFIMPKDKLDKLNFQHFLDLDAEAWNLMVYISSTLEQERLILHVGDDW